jgi:hypothetical protein
VSYDFGTSPEQVWRKLGEILSGQAATSSKHTTLIPGKLKSLFRHILAIALDDEPRSLLSGLSIESAFVLTLYWQHEEQATSLRAHGERAPRQLRRQSLPVYHPVVLGPSPHFHTDLCLDNHSLSSETAI